MLAQGGADGSIANKVRVQYYLYHVHFYMFVLLFQAEKNVLHLAVDKNWEGVVTQLLERGASVDAVDAVR